MAPAAPPPCDDTACHTALAQRRTKQCRWRPPRRRRVTRQLVTLLWCSGARRWASRRRDADRDPDGRRRRAGAQPLHQGRRQPRRARGARGDRPPARLGGAARARPGRSRPRGSDWFLPLDANDVRTIDRTGGTFLHTSRTNPSRVRPKDVPPHLAHRIDGDGPFDFTDHALRVIESIGNRRADPDRRRRHALVRAADARRGRAGDRDPEDDGQRRPRHRLLHRLLDRDHARRPVHPQPAHEHRLARADRGHRAVRALQRRDVADHRLPRRRRPRRHLRGPVRHRQARPAAGRGQAREPVELRDGDRVGGRDARRRRDGAVGRGGRLRAPQARGHRRARRAR